MLSSRLMCRLAMLIIHLSIVPRLIVRLAMHSLHIYDFQDQCIATETNSMSHYHTPSHVTSCNLVLRPLHVLQVHIYLYVMRVTVTARLPWLQNIRQHLWWLRANHSYHSDRTIKDRSTINGS